ncbi:MAG: DsbE family thiol:disulfide interchange protein [Phyllobacteriaceae bacterium]|nr:DsbE family thiol:disulfide interchange protein [Phyllobacteriaceae bacterium]
MLFAALAAFFLWKLETGGDPSTLPSVLLGKPAPTFDLKPVPVPLADGSAMPGLSSADLKAPGPGKVTIVNFWASWCVECRVEHETLKALKTNPRVRLVGIAYKDEPQNAAGWLRDMGNPYVATGLDLSGRVGIDWGVYGVPETYVVRPDGVIAYKFIGPLSEGATKAVLGPKIDEALAAVGK